MVSDWHELKEVLLHLEHPLGECRNADSALGEKWKRDPAMADAVGRLLGGKTQDCCS